MLNNADIKIIYLKLLHRLPTDQEITDATDSLEDFLKNTNEYKTLHNLPVFDYFFDNTNNTFTVSKFTNGYKRGCSLTNGSIGIQTSSFYNVATKAFIKSDHIEYTIPDFTNVTFQLNNSNMTLSNHSQTLDMNNCKFIDNFTLNSNIDISIEKFPLHNYPSCFLQKFTVTSAQNYDLSLHHLFDQKDESVSFMLSSVHFSFVRDKTIMVTNMYTFPQSTFVYRGFDNYNNMFDISIQANIPFVFYIITTASFSKKHNIDNLQQTQLYSLDEIIQNHSTHWNNTWSRINITNKSNISQNDKHIDKVNFTIVNALFNVFSDVYATDHLYHLPMLILLKPNLAKPVLDFLVKNDTDNMMSVNGFVLYKKALLSIHAWNIFRVTKDKNWLQNIGFPLMQKNTQLLFEVFHDSSKSFRNVYALNNFKQTNNALTNYFVTLAVEYTIQATYELNYAPLSSYSTFLNHIQNINVFNHNTFVTLNDTDVRIKLGSNNNMYHYDFYDSSNNYIGYNFGGSSGYKLSLVPDTEYTFSVDESTFDFPIMFKNMNDSNQILNYNQNEYLLQSVFTDNSSNLQGYSLFTSNMHSIFKENFNHNVGENAFISQSINDIIIPYSNYSFEPLEFVEPYLMFNSYYNDNLLSKKHDKTSLSHMIKDNLTFYASSSENHLNTLFEAGLQGFVSQYESKYVNKRTCVNLFYNKILSVLDFSEPWNHNKNNEIGLIIIFVIITCIFELEPRGKTNQNRFMIQPYGLGYTNRNVLPDPWKQISILNTGIENRTSVVNNTLYIDNPFDTLIEGTRFTPILNELENTIALHTNIEDIFPSSNNLQYSILLQNISDLNEYGMIQIKTHPLRVDNSNFVVDSFIPLQNDQSNVYIVPEFYERVVNVYSSYDGVEKFFSKTIPVLTDITSTDLINPTIHATMSFESSNQMNVNMNFNSFDKTLYQTFNHLDINIFYNNNIVTSNVSFISDKKHTFDNFHSNLNITITPDSLVASANYNIGTLSFELKQDIMFNLNAGMPVPFYGSVSSFTQKSIYITNPEEFPPTAFKVSQPSTNFVSKMYSLDSNLSSIIPSNPIQHLSILYNDRLEPYNISDILTSDTYLYDVRDCVDHSFFTLCNMTTSSLEYYAIGNNSNNMLMTSLVNQNDIPTLTRCEQFENFLINNNLTNYTLFTTNTFNLLLTDTNTVYGIGYNESYNLGLHDTHLNINVNTFQPSTNINRLIEQLSTTGSNLSHICLNNKATFLCFNSNTMYGVGEIDLFSYCDVITDDGSSNLLKTPKLLPKINHFFHSNNHYSIKKIESGLEHLKFFLYNSNTSKDEWWGIGRNSQNSLGINPFVETDFDMKYMKRLHLIEQLIHGQKYDVTYIGESITNSTAYHFISGNGSPNAFTAIMDMITYDTYNIGTPIASSINSNIHNWKKINNYDMSSNIPNFAITFSNNIMIGH